MGLSQSAAALFLNFGIGKVISYGKKECMEKLQ